MIFGQIVMLKQKQAKDDEDEGSPLRDGVNQLLWLKKSKVQRKPSGCAIIQFSFPPVNNFAESPPHFADNAAQATAENTRKMA